MVSVSISSHIFLPVYDIIKDIMNNNKQLDTQMKTADKEILWQINF